MATKTVKIREAWLNSLRDALAPEFKKRGFIFPADKTRNTCGWPSSGGTGSRKKTIGQAFPASSSDGGMHEIFISPVIEDDMQVAEIFVHEAAHVVCFEAYAEDCGHGPKFKAVAKGMHLGGKMTATEGTDASRALLQPILDRIGPYPHRKLNAGSKRKQGTRMIKAACPGEACASDSGATYTVRLTRTWLDKFGEPICPACQIKMVAEIPDEPAAVKPTPARPADYSTDAAVRLICHAIEGGATVTFKDDDAPWQSIDVEEIVANILGDDECNVITFVDDKGVEIGAAQVAPRCGDELLEGSERVIDFFYSTADGAARMERWAASGC